MDFEDVPRIPSIRRFFIPASVALLLIAGATLLLNSTGASRLLSLPAFSCFTTDRTQTEAVALASDEAATSQAIRFLEQRVSQDPEDFTAQNNLASYSLKRLRETGNLGFYERAAAAAQASLQALPAAGNPGGLAVLALSESAIHHFSSARDHALQLIKLQPGKSQPYEILGDALLELGEYGQAKSAFASMAQRAGVHSISTETRLARLALLDGDHQAAQQHFATALTLALELSQPPRDTVAWCYWQLGETAFAGGDYQTAEHHYQNALTVYADYPQALASLARVQAAQGQLAEAINNYRGALRVFPDPAFFAALGDLYRLDGNEKQASAQYALVEQIATLGIVNGEAYNRQLLLYYADHDLKPEQAYASAVREYALRRDIYGADAVAWSALKLGKLSAAQAAMEQALRLGTRDARLFYHAGMIARAAGDNEGARDYLHRALELNPNFDPWQANIARQALSELKTP